MTLKDAYRVLHLNEDATREDVEAAYLKLTEHRTSPERLNEIQDAYNMISEHIKTESTSNEDSKLNRFLTFFKQHKWTIFFGGLGTLMAGGLLFMVLNGFMNQKQSQNNPPDLSMMLFGDFSEDDLSVIKERITKAFPDWEAINVDTEYAPGDEGTDLELLLAPKSLATLATAKTDVYIFDEYFFDVFTAGDGAIEITSLNNHPKHIKDENNRTVGLDITDHPLFKDTVHDSQSKRIIIPQDAPQQDHAIELMNHLAQSF